ncbi:hypothetical protein F4778DRAFT_762659 [Xylariomycetidae sp. FL2044]|nr:hypothetical protein F4778DRAFT_762659 [Xylariomycetidae sp. FL2044]
MAESYSLAMSVVMIVTGVLGLFFISLRLLSKRFSAARIKIDDMVLIFSYILYLVFIVLSIYSTTLGLGKHAQDLDLARVPDLLYILPIAQFFAVLSVAVSKSSFILTLLALVTQAWMKAVLWFMLITINLSMVSISIVQFFQCSVPPTPGCVPGYAVIGLGVFAAGYSAALDLVLTAFPTMIIWNVQMKLREKVGIIICMSLGVVAGVIGIYKSSTIPAVSRSTDFTYGTALVLIWLAAEVTATIVACSIPFFRPLVRRMSKGGTKQSNSYGLSNISGSRGLRSGHNKLGSVVDVKSVPDSDNSSDKAILGPRSTIVRKTNITVAYSSEEEMGNGDSARRQMF